MKEISAKNGMKLHYLKPASDFTEALPLGNGKMGAMLFGGIEEELIQLNEDTLWSGMPGKYAVPEARPALPMIREALFNEDYHKANELCGKLQGPYSQSYMPMGNLRIKFSDQPDPEDYLRELDISHATAKVSYEAGKTKYERTCFTSFPDKALIMKISTKGKGRLNFVASMDSLLRNSQSRIDARTVAMSGRAPVHIDPAYCKRDLVSYDDNGGVAFDVKLRVVAEGGRVTSTDKAIEVRNASSVVLFLVSATSFNGFDKLPGKEGVVLEETTSSIMSTVSRKDFDELKKMHVKDHRKLFDRCWLELGDGDISDLPTDERLKKYDGKNDPRLAVLLFQYGRYLMIASSRPGTQATNLQGIWNDLFRPPWSSNYTININTEMNYWPAEPANLSECHGPLFDLIEKLSVAGEKIASENYGCKGWVAHHNTDLWGHACAVGDYGNGNPQWSCWQLGGGWLATHLWEHFAFTQDTKFLKEKAYPLLKKSAEFYLDWLVPHKINGTEYLVTAPATSPENSFIAPGGKPECVSIASTMDMGIIRELFTDCAMASEILDVDKEFSDRIKKASGKLLPFQIGRNGRLQEWYKDFDDGEPHHRHVSHLFALHPGSQITRDGTPELFNAAKRTLEIRGDEGTGWSLAWKINFWARLFDGDRCLRLISRMLRVIDAKNVEYHGGGVYINLLDAHPPFQIDGNFGVTAGICEMLLQSHEKISDYRLPNADSKNEKQKSKMKGFIIRLFPALPADWKNGSVKGLVARGGFTVDIGWKDGALVKALIRSSSGNICRIRSAGKLEVSTKGRGLASSYNGELLEFPTVKGHSYEIAPGQVV
ncbi:MAG: glycoside hydrolase family 95 protein [Victivallales bacterium]